MKAKKLLITAVMAFVAVNFIGCKEEEKEYTWEDCIEKVNEKLADGSVFYSDVLNKTDVVSVNAYYEKRKEIETGSEVSIGTSENNMTRLTEQGYALEPFTLYYIKYKPYFVYGKDTTFNEEKTVKIYATPRANLELKDVDYGIGEPALNIHWGLLTENGNNIVEKDCYEGKVSSVKVYMTTDDVVAYNREPIEFSTNTDSCYITQGGTYEKPDFPAYIIKYWKDGKKIIRYLSVKYDIKVEVAIKVGDKDFVYTGSIKNILMDKQQFVCDVEFDIYRIAKIGNQTWTIDNTYPIFDEKKEHQPPTLSAFYGETEVFYSFKGIRSVAIPGYKMAEEKDWDELLAYYGIKMPQEIIGREIDKLLAKDTSMQKYFTTEGNWDYLLSEFGWKDDDGNDLRIESGVFNALPTGIILEDNMSSSGEYEFATFDYGNGSRVLISNHYKGVAHLYASKASYRYVKIND